MFNVISCDTQKHVGQLKVYLSQQFNGRQPLDVLHLLYSCSLLNSTFLSKSSIFRLRLDILLMVFPFSFSAPLSVKGSSVALDFFVDQSSVELLTSEGTMSMTNLVFPQSIYNTLSVSGANYEAQMRSLKSIW